MAYLALEEFSDLKAVQAIRRQYQVSKSKASEDYAQFKTDLDAIIRPDSCPICSLDDLEITAPFSTRPSSPYRMDLALTYRCNNNCSHCYNGRPRNFPELKTNQWKEIIDRVWSLGIPHIVFTGGEPTLRDDLPDLVTHAEANGQITGLNTNARRLNDTKYLEALVNAGLDHVQITVESHDPVIHDRMVARQGAWEQTIAGLRNVLNTPLYVMTNTTILQENKPYLSDTLDFLGRGLTVGTGLLESELPPLLDIGRNKTGQNNQRLIWYTPTQYCQFDPTQLELGVKGCTAALYNMCIEPDGGVIPCQSYYHQLGNLLSDPWNSIWNHDLSVRLREREYIMDECQVCDLLSECGGGCPLALEAQSQNLIEINRIAVVKDW
jgi:radical SAM protein with 4Fe4S-binding SPASM domain